MNLLDLVRDLSHLIVDLNAGLSGKANEFGIVQDLGEFGGAHELSGSLSRQRSRSADEKTDGEASSTVDAHA